MIRGSFDQYRAGDHGPHEPRVYKQLWLSVGLSIFGIGAALESKGGLAALLLAAASVMAFAARRSMRAARRAPR